MAASVAQTPFLHIEAVNMASQEVVMADIPASKHAESLLVSEVELAASIALPSTPSLSATTSSPKLAPVDDGMKLDDTKLDDLESGYASATSDGDNSPSSSVASLPPRKVHLSQEHIDFLNAQLEHMTPQEILRFSRILFPNLYQSTAFGLTGLATLDMLAEMQKESPSARPVDLIFLDTLHHFDETYDLVRRVQARYPGQKLHVYKPWGAETAAEFEALYGPRMWELASEMYDYTVKVEPLDRAYEELGVAAVITGRRRSQGGARGAIPVLELDEERGGVVKINPMANWSFAQVWQYVQDRKVPYNALLDRGYKSIGDWHSTVPVAEGEDERAGRWKGQQKTECGIHNRKSRYSQFVSEQQGGVAAASEQTIETISVEVAAH